MQHLIGNEASVHEREELRAEMMGHHGDNALRFQAAAIQRYGAAGGVMVRELLFWDCKGWDPDGWIWVTKEDMTERTGISARSQDRARKRLVDAGVLEAEPRPRRNRQGACWHPSRTLHYKLNLAELMEQMSTDTEQTRGDTAVTTAVTPDVHATLENDQVARSNTPSGALEHTKRRAPLIEGTSEETTEGFPYRGPESNSDDLDSVPTSYKEEQKPYNTQRSEESFSGDLPQSGRGTAENITEEQARENRARISEIIKEGLSSRRDLLKIAEDLKTEHTPHNTRRRPRYYDPEDTSGEDGRGL